MERLRQYFLADDVKTKVNSAQCYVCGPAMNGTIRRLNVPNKPTDKLFIELAILNV